MKLRPCTMESVTYAAWGWVCSASKIFNTEATGRATVGHGESQHALRAVFDPRPARSARFRYFLRGPQWPSLLPSC